LNSDEKLKFKNVIDEVIESKSRINELKPIKYWYPLSQATFGTDEILEAIDSLCGFRTSMAEKTHEFEKEFSSWQGCNSSIMVNSGSSADLLICHLLSNPLNPLIPKNSEIIIPIVTWPTQIWSAMMAGFNVKFVDVDPQTLNLDINDLRKIISKDTKALFLVHLLGNPCNMDEILEICAENNVQIIEDCCEAMGASWDGVKVGNFGIASSFSFFFSHHITTMEGGMICVQNAENTEQLKLLRAHGWVRNVDPENFGLERYPDLDSRYAFVNWGFNVRPTELQAGFGLHQLKKVDIFAEKRKKISRKFNSYLNEGTFLKTPLVHSKASPSWLALPIMVDESAPFSRDEIVLFLEKNGVETRPIVAGNLSEHPVANIFKAFKDREFPGAGRVHKRGFYIGLSPMQDDTAIDKLIDLFKQFLSIY
jgi:CDP-6-deoxy-D-xylo-4-hexulose-3-dehydrase